MYGDAVVSQILFVQRFGVLFRDVGDDDFPGDLVENPLVEVVRPQPTLFLLKSEEVAAGLSHNRQIDEVGFCNCRAFQCVVCSEQLHFFLPTSPLGGIRATPPTDCRGRH